HQTNQPGSPGKLFESQAGSLWPPELRCEDGVKSPCAVNLHNAVMVSQQRLRGGVAQLSSARMNEVCAALALLFGLRFRLAFRLSDIPPRPALPCVLFPDQLSCAVFSNRVQLFS